MDATDYSALLALFGSSTSGLTESQKLVDHNRDDIIDTIDYAIVVQNFGRIGAAKP